MSFKEEIDKLENAKIESTYLIKKGSIPIILTAPHTMKQRKRDGSIKLNEPFTKAIAKYVSNKTGCSYLIKQRATKIDSNWEEVDDFKLLLERFIHEHEVKLLIDIHGASSRREFDVELGTLNNLSVRHSTIKSLRNAFFESGIYEIALNNPFKGGGITKYIFGKTEIDVIQIEINGKYRNINNAENMERLCNALIKFIRKYVSNC